MQQFFSGGGGGKWGNIKAIFYLKFLSIITPFLKSNKVSFSLRRLTQLEFLQLLHNIRDIILPLLDLLHRKNLFLQVPFLVHRGQCCQLSWIIWETPDSRLYLPDNCCSLPFLVDWTYCQLNFKYFALFDLFYCKHRMFLHKLRYAIVTQVTMQLVGSKQIRSNGQMLQNYSNNIFFMRFVSSQIFLMIGVNQYFLYQ